MSLCTCQVLFIFSFFCDNTSSNSVFACLNLVKVFHLRYKFCLILSIKRLIFAIFSHSAFRAFNLDIFFQDLCHNSQLFTFVKAKKNANHGFQFHRNLQYNFGINYDNNISINVFMCMSSAGISYFCDVSSS